MTETIKTRYKYIEFSDGDGEGGMWVCANRYHGDSLGCVEFYSPWRRWVFTPNHDTTFSADCLRDVIHFMSQLPNKRT